MKGTFPTITTTNTVKTITGILVEMAKHSAHTFAQQDPTSVRVSRVKAGGQHASCAHPSDVDVSDFTCFFKPLCPVYIMAMDMRYCHHL